MGGLLALETRVPPEVLTTGSDVTGTPETDEVGTVLAADALLTIIWLVESAKRDLFFHYFYLKSREKLLVLIKA